MIWLEPLVTSMLSTEDRPVASEADVDLIETLPLAVYEVVLPRELHNGPYQIGAVFDLELTVFAATREASIQEADKMIEDLKAMEGKTSEYGWVSSVSIGTLPWRNPGANAVEGIHSMTMSARIVARHD